MNILASRALGHSPKPILHPTRFSFADRGTFRVACALASDNNAELVVVHVADRRRLYDCNSYRQAIEGRLEALRSSRPDIQISTLVMSGDPVTEIVVLSRDLNCELIVMRPSARRWLHGYFVESLSKRVNRLARCSVLFVDRDSWQPKRVGELHPIDHNSTDAESERRRSQELVQATE